MEKILHGIGVAVFIFGLLVALVGLGALPNPCRTVVSQSVVGSVTEVHSDLLGVGSLEVCTIDDRGCTIVYSHGNVGHDFSLDMLHKGEVVVMDLNEQGNLVRIRLTR